MRVALCDDHSLFLEAMATAPRSLGVDVVADCAEPSHAVHVVAATAPAVILLEVGFPGDDGVSSSRDHARSIRSAACRFSAVRSTLLVEANGSSSTNQTERGC